MTYFGRKNQVKKQKSNLDERQEQALLRIERNGCWLAFWALLASLFIQQAVFGMGELKTVAGEWIIFMLLAVYLAAACIKNGIWDRRLKANPKTNLLVSLAAAILFAAVFAVVGYCNYRSLPGAAATFAVLFPGLFVVLFGALSLSAAMYKKRAKALEEASCDGDGPEEQD